MKLAANRWGTGDEENDEEKGARRLSGGAVNERYP